MKGALVTMAVLGTVVLSTSACSSNEAKSYVPGASELCCHGNWKVTLPEEDRACRRVNRDLLQPAEDCWERSYYNVKIRPGEPDRVDVVLGVMSTEEEAEKWLSRYSPPGSNIQQRESPPPNVGWEAKAWEYPDLSGIEVAFRRDNVVVLVYVWSGSPEDRRVMVESVDEAVLDRFLEWEDYPP